MAVFYPPCYLSIGELVQRLYVSVISYPNLKSEGKNFSWSPGWFGIYQVVESRWNETFAQLQRKWTVILDTALMKLFQNETPDRPLALLLTARCYLSAMDGLQGSLCGFRMTLSGVDIWRFRWGAIGLSHLYSRLASEGIILDHEGIISIK